MGEESVDSILPPMPNNATANSRASSLRLGSSNFGASSSMTWAPGVPEIIEDKLISDGGWKVHPGALVFLYRRRPLHGDARQQTRGLNISTRFIPTTPSTLPTGALTGCNVRA